MSYMCHQSDFNNSQVREIDFSSQITTLTDNEISFINGGLAPLAWIAIVGARCVASTACRVGVVAAAGTAAAFIGYENNRV